MLFLEQEVVQLFDGNQTRNDILYILNASYFIIDIILFICFSSRYALCRTPTWLHTIYYV